MLAQQFLFGSENKAYGFSPAFCELGNNQQRQRQECREPETEYCAASPRMIRSVVEEAGFGRFVYLEGASGKRYVFSSIRSEQFSLYENAIFAATLPGEDSVRVGKSLAEVESFGSVFFVHLLDDDIHCASGEKSALDDLRGTH